MSTPDWLQELFDKHDAEMADIRWLDRQRAKTAQAKKQGVPANVDKDHSRPRPQPAQQQSTATMTPEQQKKWDEYIYAAINRKWEEELTPMVLRWIDRAADELSEAIAEAFSIERKRVRDEAAALRKELIDEIAITRTDAAIDRATTRETIINLPAFVRRRDRDVA
jgi:hypothetical protein